jgi:hydrogenase maturation protease
MCSTLVIGIGNTLRCDDGAGVRAAHVVQTRIPTAKVLTAHQLTPDFAETISTHARVVILDASVQTDELQVTHVRPSGDPAPRGSHASTAENILALSHSVYGCAPEDVLLVEIPAHCLEFREGLSPATEREMKKAVDIVERFLLRNDL